MSVPNRVKLSELAATSSGANPVKGEGFTPGGTRKGPSQNPLTKPLTDPAELFTLFGRFVAAWILTFMTVAFLINGDDNKRIFAVPFGCASLIVQFATVRLWRKLSRERLANKVAREEALATLGQEQSEGNPQA
jgi:hypothetical protein